MRISDWSSDVCSSDLYQTYVALGQAYYFTDQPAQAIENYRKAAPLAPDGETYLNLARILWGEGQLGEAKQAAQKALDNGVKQPEEARKILARSEERRAGKECVGKCRSRWSRYI